METMTIREAVEKAQQILLNIAVPRGLNAQIGVPIDQAIGLLGACVGAFERADTEAAEATKAEAAGPTEAGEDEPNE